MAATSPRSCASGDELRSVEIGVVAQPVEGPGDVREAQQVDAMNVQPLVIDTSNEFSERESLALPPLGECVRRRLTGEHPAHQVECFRGGRNRPQFRMVDRRRLLRPAQPRHEMVRTQEILERHMQKGAESTGTRLSEIVVNAVKNRSPGSQIRNPKSEIRSANRSSDFGFRISDFARMGSISRPTPSGKASGFVMRAGKPVTILRPARSREQRR